jgi:RND family efflux transporter MFP subunit
MRSQTVLCSAILAGGLMLLSGCKGKESKVSAAAPIPVQTAVAEEVAVDSSAHYSATIEPDTTVEMAFKVDGYVESLLKLGGRNVQEGDFVVKGSVLARVRQSDYRASLDGSRARTLQAVEAVNVAAWQLTQAEALYTKASLDADRATALYQEKALTKPDLDAARAQVDSTRAQVEAARKNVEAQRNLLESAKAQERSTAILFDDTALVAPMSAVILEKRIEPGALVGRAAPAFRLGDVSTVRMAFSVPDTLVAKMALGAILPVHIDAMPDRSFPGRVRQIAAAADPATRLYRVEVALPNPQQVLRTGMMGKVSVPGSQSAVLRPAVPATALLRSPSDPNAASVFVVEETNSAARIARLRTIRMGEFVGSRVTVLAGLQPGEPVVTGGKQNLVDGAVIRVTE